MLNSGLRKYVRLTIQHGVARLAAVSAADFLSRKERLIFKTLRTSREISSAAEDCREPG